jgi:hypothetical protein
VSLSDSYFQSFCLKSWLEKKTPLHFFDNEDRSTVFVILMLHLRICKPYFKRELNVDFVETFGGENDIL